MKLTSEEKHHLEGYALGLTDLVRKVTYNSMCSKSYDPMTIDDVEMHSYAFNLKDGGRHHPLSDYENIKEIKDLMLKEAADEFLEIGEL